MTARLPIPGSDDGDWGDILNNFLEVSLSSTGTLNSGVVGTTNIANGAVTDSQVSSSAAISPTKISGTAETQSNKNQPSGYAGLNASTQLPVALLPANIPLSNLNVTGTASSSTYLRGDGSWTAVPTASNATTLAPGLVQLAGDLAGTSTTATAPTLANTSNVQTVVNSIIGSNSTVTSKAPLASPALTGTPTAPTQAAGDSTTAIATDAFVMAAGVKGRAATFTIAASNSQTTSKEGADYVCTGTNDDTIINTAFAALPGLGGTVLLLPGDYYLGASSGSGIVVGIGGSKLEGAGREKGATIHVPASFAGAAGIKVTGTGNGFACTIRDLYMIFDNPTGVTAPGIWTLCNEPQIQNVKIEYAGGTAFLIDGPSGIYYDGLIMNCEAVFAGSGTPGDGFVVTANMQNCVITDCWVQGGTAYAAALLNSALVSGNIYTSLSVSPLGGSISSGDSIIIDLPNANSGASQSQIVTASASASAGATTISVNSFTANGNYTANFAVVADKTKMITRNGFNIQGAGTHLNNCHPYMCYEAGLQVNTTSNLEIFVIGGEYETNAWCNINWVSINESVLGSVSVYGLCAYTAVRIKTVIQSTISGLFVDAQSAINGMLVTNCTGITVSGCTVLNAVGTNGCAFYVAGNFYCTLVSNTIYYSLAGGTTSFEFYSNTYTLFANNNNASSISTGFGGTNTGSVVRSNIGFNPFGTQSVSIPSSTSAVAAQVYDRTFYITAASSGTTTVAISGGPTITIPASSLAAVHVPANCTLTPTYTSAPTWVVEGE